MLVVNKWNGKEYEVLGEDGKTVTLKRCSDGTVFEIEKSEFNFSYKNFNIKGVSNVNE